MHATNSGCSGLTSENISNSVTIIGVNAFYGCSSLTSINIPNSVTIIGDDAFSGCSKLTSVTIPNSVTNIGNYAFSGCSGLILVTIPSYVTRIGENTFDCCYGLKELHITGKDIIDINTNPFGILNLSKVSLYVSRSTIEYYKTTSPWNTFGGIFVNEINLDDDSSEFAYNVDSQLFEILTYTRTFSHTNWQALYVPFSMRYDDWKDNFEVANINDVHQYDDDEDGTIDRTDVEVIKLKEGKSIEPNTPYLIKAKTTGEKIITLEDATLYKTEENTYDVTSWFTRFNFIGTYHTVTDMATKGYYAMAEGTLKQATSNAVTLNPFRWYLSVTDRNGNAKPLNSKSINIVFDDGETTGIENVNNEAKESSSIHTLTGISKGNDAKTLAPGIYIKNGKKFIVK